ncbi:MAG TPA: hypothetical protein VH684_29890 [Xanthobacteraceae bacterium]|jgi:hypothetical protein
MHSLSAALALATALLAPAAAQAFDEAKYPDWKGQWRRAEAGPPRYDPSRPLLDQQAPLNAEYQAIHAASLADQAAGGQGNDPTYTCIAPGMPRITNVYDPMEIVITPGTTHMLIQHIHDSRRILTDGRDWPSRLDQVEPTFTGISIGRWIDTDGDGRYDLLEVETRLLRGPRAFDATGLPLHKDNQTIVKERIYADKGNSNMIVDEIVTFDHALTRPWSAVKHYRRVAGREAVWPESVCAEANVHVEIGGQNYFLSADGYLMPARKDQPPPDLKYFKQSQK